MSIGLWIAIGLVAFIGLGFLALLVAAEMMRSNGPRWPAWARLLTLPIYGLVVGVYLLGSYAGRQRKSRRR
jgi:H+/Cl- antiporter ClcA